ncbi:pre-rRNA 2'-O-ribose RNA methyltransferase FTSJ3-like [Haliotis rufescens]|uniref:pre-rRNA 2'-O-ribose RNA methyltransferase FTSJ3-like n=1 Tax=Haliotis rufescens TaxID=6454 RepID=UPI00201F136E|nr:pre-rRNA 2'-O-ribose RNA methyltransferase FTSJ3-like [Haliotis rufescens]
MGKKAKVGKARKDKFYKLAKETGYRARSAFKLIQLNRKFEFLEKARVVVDLCAAPGGWLQVASQNTPISSLIVGIDLVSIRPIPKCTTFQADITTEKCRQILKQELKTWKADVFLNDGAPNVGKNWVHDAYQQAELTLYAVKLATDFLRKGGSFVTKVFRSKDYYSLLWVLQQLFHTVNATKPQASRNESAEIFVVCQGFLAPDKIDPKFLNPKHVFQDVEQEGRQLLDLIHPEKKKRNREGYADGDYTLFHTLSASQFLAADNFLELLAGANQVTLDEERITNHRLTTPEMKECLKDIKVLGKKDIKGLLTWRKKLREELGVEAVAITEDAADADRPDGSKDDAEPSDEEDLEVEKQLVQMEDDERKALKRKLKKIRREKTKLRHKMDMKMVLPNDKPDITDDVDIFDLKKIKNKKHLKAVDEDDQAMQEEELEWDDDPLPPPAKRRTLSYDRHTKDYLEREDASEEEYDSDPDLQDDDRPGPSADVEEGEHNPLLVDLQKPGVKTSNRTNSWFSKSAFADIEDDADEDAEIEKIADRYRSKGGQITDKSTEKTPHKKKAPAVKEDHDEDDDDDDDDDSDTDSDSGSDYDTMELQAGPGHQEAPSNKKQSRDNKDGFEIVPSANTDKLDAVGMALGSALAQSRKRKRDIIDNAYHRYMFDDDGLPDWFVKDESRHSRIQLPVTKGDIQEYRDKLKSVDARPIKKVAEAKARKKKKEVRRLDRARKRAEVVTDSTEVSDKEKWQQIKQIYKKAGLLYKKKKEVTYVVAKKGGGKRPTRPSGVSGIYKVVDRRMKKEKRAEKRKAKKGGSKHKGGRKGKK